VECESASLSRDIRGFVSIIPGVASYIRATPRESLESVLSTIRQYVKPGRYNPRSRSRRLGDFRSGP